MGVHRRPKSADMPDLLLELFSEEIPARMQGQAARDLERMARERLEAAGLAAETLQTFAGPRRLTLVARGLPAAQPDRIEARRGPRTTAPDAAVEGFLRSTGLTRAQLEVQDGAYLARIERPGRPTAEIVAEMVEAIVRGFPWPKSMRWGSGSLRWVRPLRRILCLFDGAVVPFAIEGIASGDVTEGHRFMGERRGPFRVAGLEDYAAGLAERFVVLDPAERRRYILEDAQAVCAERGLELVPDEGLLDEVTGLTEWPVPILGDMDAGFLDLPAEVISTAMRVHQRYFSVREPAPNNGETGRLAPHFVVVANIAPHDGGALIAAGNARVLSARLADARFFWDEDRRAGADGRANFDRWLDKLQGVTFHAKLGTMAERVARITALAREIAPLVGADPELAAEAARLCKADLASGMVGEFPELQGVMGGYYARAAHYEPSPLMGEGAPHEPSPLTGEGRVGVASGAPSGEPRADTPTPTLPRQGGGRVFTAAEADQIADAVRDHYKPQGPSDSVPTAPVTVAVALADKLDTLVGFFAIDERPTGSRDPYALRRAALGVIRLALSSDAKFMLSPTLLSHTKIMQISALNVAVRHPVQNLEGLEVEDILQAVAERAGVRQPPNQIAADLLAFLADRLKVLLREEGKRHDLVDAVFAPINGQVDDDLVRIVARVEALDRFLKTEDGASLLAGYRRASNILKAEAKKHPGEDYGLNADLGLITLPEEQRLAATLRTVAGEVDRALDREDFADAMRVLSHLRTPVDEFFDKVLVNDPDPAVRLNRLRLLSQVRATAERIADFSRIAG